MNMTKSELQEVNKELFSDLEGILKWTWDKNFQALLAEFSAKDQEKVSSILEKHLNLKWDSDSISTAPDTIKSTTGLFGDLRQNQMLFTSDPEGNVFVYAAWWPWGDGDVISVRILSPGDESSDSEKPGILSRILGIFK